MSRAIGDYAYKGKQYLAIDAQEVIAVPDVTKATIEQGDLMVVCCDGIVEQLSNEQVCEFIYENAIEQYADKGYDMSKEGFDRSIDLVQGLSKLLEHSIKSGSKDNMTAMFVVFKDAVEGEEGFEGKEGQEVTEAIFLPGPYTPFKNNKEYADAYLADAAKWGLSTAEAEKRAIEAEKDMDLTGMQAVADRADGGGMNRFVGLLSALSRAQGWLLSLMLLVFFFP